MRGSIVAASSIPSQLGIVFWNYDIVLATLLHIIMIMEMERKIISLAAAAAGQGLLRQRSAIVVMVVMVTVISRDLLEKIENLNLPKGGEKMSGTFIPPQKDRGKARGKRQRSPPFRKSRHLTLANQRCFERSHCSIYRQVCIAYHLPAPRNRISHQRQ